MAPYKPLLMAQPLKHPQSESDTDGWRRGKRCDPKTVN